jgi:anthranilate synthase component 2
MILLIDNYDSFSYNLYQLIGAVEPDIRVVRNDAVTAEDVEKMDCEAIFLSPGPGRPENAGVCMELVSRFAGETPIFGVCLGHQAICAAFGATVGYARALCHGKVSEVTADPDSRLFAGLTAPFPVARYHSLAVEAATLPDCLRVTAHTADGEVMAVEHREYPVCGVQFHPESVMTPAGETIIRNFMESIRR